MKTKSNHLLLLAVILLVAGCDKEGDTGTLEFRMINPVNAVEKSVYGLKSLAENPPLTGDTTATINTSFLFGVGDVWVSQEKVVAGEPDDLLWVRLTSETNHELKLFEDYSFAAVEIPAGTYQSIKISLRNVFYRYAKLVSDPDVTFELLETMGSWTDACDPNDTSWVAPNYFSDDGNHHLNDDGVFELVTDGEKIGGFTIEAGAHAVVSWRLGAGVTEPCICYLIDENGNRVWDCGVDRMEFECPPEAIYMWDFVVEYIEDGKLK